MRIETKEAALQALEEKREKVIKEYSEKHEELMQIEKAYNEMEMEIETHLKKEEPDEGVAFFATKVKTPAEIKEQIKVMTHNALERYSERYVVKETIELKTENFEKLISDLISDFEPLFLKKYKGGYTTDSQGNQARHVTRIKSRDKYENLLIDAQGYNYPRYVAIEK